MVEKSRTDVNDTTEQQSDDMKHRGFSQKVRGVLLESHSSKSEIPVRF